MNCNRNPNMPNRPNMSNMPNRPNMANMPNRPNMANMPNRPNMANMSNMQNRPNMSNMPNMPNRPNRPNMPNMPFVQSLFAVDLGVDLGALQPEIAECKRRFQQDLWNTICNKVLQGSSGWKKMDSANRAGWDKEVSGETNINTRSEEKAAEDDGEGKEEPEDVAENVNNASKKYKKRGNKDQQPTGGRQHLVRQSRPRDAAPVPIKRNPMSGWRRVNSVHGSVARVEQPAGSNNDNHLMRHPQPQRQPQQPAQKQDAAWRPSCNGERSQAEEPSRFVKQQSNAREQQRPSAGAVHAACKARTFAQQQQEQSSQKLQQQLAYPRSYSATSHREILGANSFESEPAMTLDADEFVDASELAAVDPDARVLFYDRDTGRLTLNGGYSQMFSGRRQPELDESSSCLTPRPGNNFDAESNATRDFVPLYVGDWVVSSNPRMQSRQIM